MPLRSVVRSGSEKLSCFDGAQHDTNTLVCLPEPVEGSKDKRSSIRMMICCLIILIHPGIFTSCDLPHQPGPMPTEIVETEFEPGLNIMGVLRADDQSGTSFININRALTTEEIYSDSIPNFSPQIDYAKVSSIESGAEYQFLRSEDTSDWGNYMDTTLSAEAGVAYELEIKASGFPMLTGHTRVPAKPQIVANSLLVGANAVSFQLQHHASAYEYRLYLFFAESILEKDVHPSNGEIIDIAWSFGSDRGNPVYLQLIALDENLTRYGDSPISFIPNTYHPDGSTVEGGYGCFGSVAVTSLELN